MINTGISLSKLSKKHIEFFKKSPRVFGKVVSHTLDGVAYKEAMSSKKYHIGKELITRGKYSQSGIRYVKASKTGAIANMTSAYGADAARGYLAKQERGFKFRGFVPSAKTRPGKSKYKRMKKILYMKNLKAYRAQGDRRQMVSTLEHLAEQGKAKLNSSEVLYIEDGYPIKYNRGFYQFGNAGVKEGKYFPAMKTLYSPANKNKLGNIRKPKRWMKNTNEAIRQADFDKIFLKNVTHAMRRGK